MPRIRALEIGIKIGKKAYLQLANIINGTLEEENRILLMERISEEYMLI
jgi:hypothetical protein